MQDIFDWLQSQQENMVDLAIRWSNINSYSHNYAGLQQMASEVEREFSSLGVPVEEISLPNYAAVSMQGEQTSHQVIPLLTWTHRPQAAHQILLVGHLDTVHTPESSFQSCQTIDSERISGPGITDMKGGLVVMLYLLKAIERSQWSEHIGWRVILNSDEELGSPASGDYLTEQARNYHLGLVFEPSLPNGSLVSARKGSGNFTMVVRGKAAHAGRNPQEGRNAIDAAAAWILEVHRTFDKETDLIINMGEIYGGPARNVVADKAVVGFNVRCHQPQQQESFDKQIAEINHRIANLHEVSLKMYGEFQAPPKPLTDDIKSLMILLNECGEKLGLDLTWEQTGGVCDGNRLAAGGLPTIDTLGVRGANIHSAEEFVEVQSFSERTKLVTAFVRRWLQEKGVLDE